jgi:4-diphosphocytidyl-2C-methyl-D-erythritol kinase
VPHSGDAIRQALAAGDVQQVGQRLHNRLQPAAEAIEPLVADYQRRLEELGPAGARMSGSGSSLFAVCRDRQEALRVANELRTGPEKMASRGQAQRSAALDESPEIASREQAKRSGALDKRSAAERWIKLPESASVYLVRTCS